MSSKSYIDLTGRVAVVTGGGNGIGRGIAERLAEAGANVFVADIDGETAKKTAGELVSGGWNAASGAVDVAQQDSTDGMIREAIGALGGVDILVNNAGVGGAAGWPGRSVANVDDWHRVFEVNVLGIIHSIQSVSDHMVDRGSGKIVNIASAAGRRGSPGFAHYSTSKASAINVTQAFAYKLAPHKINVNSVCPGYLWTDLWEDIADRHLRIEGEALAVGREYFDQKLDRAPLGREQTPEDIGNAVAFLCSDRARSITGQSLNVDGGLMMN